MRLLLATAFAGGLAVAVACGSTGASGSPVRSPNPPGSPCGSGSTLDPTAAQSCAPNPQFPDCYLCVKLPNDAGAPALCEVPCRLGQSDCNAGQTCASAVDAPASGFVSESCGMLGNSLGYCR